MDSTMAAAGTAKDPILIEEEPYQILIEKKPYERKRKRDELEAFEQRLLAEIERWPVQEGRAHRAACNVLERELPHCHAAAAPEPEPEPEPVPDFTQEQRERLDKAWLDIARGYGEPGVQWVGLGDALEDLQLQVAMAASKHTAQCHGD